MKPLNIITLATLFPNAANPNFGIFVERQTAEIASRDGINLRVINPVGVPPWPLNLLPRYAANRSLAKHEEWRGLEVHRPHFPLIPKYGVSNNPSLIFDKTLAILEKIHAETPIDLIDAEFFFPDGPAAMHLAAALGVPFTVKARGADIHHWCRDPATRYQIMEAAEKAAGLLSVSQALKQDMIALGMPGEKIMVHYTGLDQGKFQPIDRAEAKAKWGVKGPLLVSVGALIERKNQSLIIEALPSLPDTTLILAGTGDQEQNYRRLAAKLGVADRVGFAGNVPHDELPKLLGAADVMVLTSKSEGLANAWVEALACGTPIVISEAGGAKELLSTPAAGQIVKADPAAIATAVKAVLADSPSQQAVRECVQRFSWKTNGDKLFEFFQNAVGK